jgi:pyruvate-formate lyase-activating enzyme
MTRISRALLPALCVVAFAVAGCGGGSGGGSTTQLSKAQYKAKLAAISKEVDSAHGDLSRGAKKAVTVSDVQSVLNRYAASEQRIGDELSNLNPPANATAANTLLGRGFHDDSAEIKTLVPKLAKLKSAAEAFAFLQSIPHTKGGNEQDTAVQKLRKLGYTTGS